MKLNVFLVVFIILSSISTAGQSNNAGVSIDPGPGGNFPSSKHFAIKIKKQSSFVYQTFKRKPVIKWLVCRELNSMSWTTVASASEVQVEVTFLQKEALVGVIIRPKRLKIESRIEGNKVIFMLPPGKKVTIEEEGSVEHVCFIFGHLEDPEPTGIAPENIITFEAGVHKLENDLLELKSNQAVVLKPGAFVMGRIHGQKLENSQILGRGTISGQHVKRVSQDYGQNPTAEEKASRRIHVSGSNLRLQGPTIVDSPLWLTKITGTSAEKLNSVTHMSALGWYINTDGFQEMHHTRASDLFTCVNDDSFVLNAVGDCIVENSVVWGQRAGAPLRLGWGGSREYAPVIYRNIDVLHCNGPAGVISLKHGSAHYVKNILVEDLYIEEPATKLIGFEIKRHAWSWGNEYGHAKDIHIRNVVADHPFSDTKKSHILGHSDEHLIENITLENITIAGKRVRNLDDIPLVVNEFTRNIRVLP